MKILLGGLLHDRGAITECYLRHLRELDLSGLEVSWFFICDGLCPELENWLWETRGCTAEERKRNGLIQAVAGDKAWVHVGDDGPHWEREPEGEEKGRPEFRRLAFLRNVLRERALMEEVDALISIDSDICVPPDLIQQLVSARHMWVSAVVDNSATRDGSADQDLVRMTGGERHFRSPCFNLGDFGGDERDRLTRVSPDLVNGGEVGSTGAVCLYSREILGQAHWVWDGRGEDIGLAVQLHRQGVRARYIPVLCDHLMTEARLTAHKESCELC